MKRKLFAAAAAAAVLCLGKAIAAEPVFVGGPYSFDGGGGVKTEANIGISGNSSFSVAVTLTPYENKQDDYGKGVIGWGKGAKNSANFLYYNSEYDRFEYGFYGNDGKTPGIYPENEEYTVINTYDGETQKIYVDGELITQRAVNTLSVSDSPLTIGSDPMGQNRNFKGEISVVKIYDYALSEGEVSEMTGTKAREYLKPLKQTYCNNIKILGFWKQQTDRMIEKWIPHCIEQLESVSYGIEAFKNAGKKLGGESYTSPKQDPWGNAYTYNTIEAMCLALTIDPDGDSELKAAQEAIRVKLEEWIPIILAAQESDGYIDTYYTLNDKARWTVKTDHEGYVMGYFIEAALAHYEMTGRTDSRLYDAARKCADLWVDTIGPSPKKFWYDGHEEMELAMVRLGRFVNETEGEGEGDKYIELAQFLCDARGGGSEYDQSHLSATEQSDAVGHSVRAAYLYTGMT
ncbi:MAG: beta-L-arabinofuranosidase domain-containing protein, partial [Clostridia bacterium]